MDTSLLYDEPMSAEEKAKLETELGGMRPQQIENWMHARAGAIDRLHQHSKQRLVVAHQVLDYKNFQARQQEKAARPANFPAAQTIGVAEKNPLVPGVQE